MESSKQENISRQSSILKLPKQRQPLQCVVVNASSYENSPSVKIKRRVSFAKNRRIREFCNEAEQDTVWDNTYEEHDLSNTKNSSNGNEHAMMISVPCDDKENFPVQLFLQNDKLLCREIPNNVLKEDNVLQYNLEKCVLTSNVKDLDIDSYKIIEEIPNTTIYCDEGMDMTTYVPSNINLENQHTDCFSDSVLISNNKNVNTEELKYLPIRSIRNLDQNQKNNNTFKLHTESNSNEFTQIISKLFTCEPPNDMNNTIKTEQNNKNSPNKKAKFDKKECVSNLPVVFNEIMETSASSDINNQKQKNEKNDNYIIKTVESSVDVPRIKICNNHNPNKFIDTSNENNKSLTKLTELTEVMPICNTEFSVLAPNSQIKNIGSKTNKLHNDSMDILQTLPTCNRINQIGSLKNIQVSNTLQEKSKIFIDEPMDLTEALPKTFLTSTDQSEKILLGVTKNKAKFFENKSLDETEALPIYIDIPEPTNTCTNIILHEVIQGSNEIFANKSVEMTEIAPIIKPTFNLNCDIALYKMSDENTNTSCNQLSYITKKCYDDDISCHITSNIKEPLLEENLNKTKIFSTSMDITDICPSYNKIKVLQESVQNETKIFENKSMEVTQAVPVYIDNPQSTNIGTNKLLYESIPQDTEFFINQSLEMTETVPINRKILEYNSSGTPTELEENINIISNTLIGITKNIHLDDISEPISLNIKEPLFEETSNKTKIFFNKSMEITEIGPASHRTKVLQESMQNRTKIFENNQMEITQIDPVYMNNPQSINVNINKLLHEVTQEDTEILTNKLMKVTEDISINKQVLKLKCQIPQFKELQGNTDISSSSLMAFGKDVHMNHISYPSALYTKEPFIEKSPNKIKIMKSMEVTEICPTYNKTKVLQGSVQNRTNISDHKSLEITEAVPVHIYNPETTNDDTNKLIHQVIQEDTEIFDNKLMEVTDTVCINRQIFPLNYNKALRKDPNKNINTLSCPVIDIINNVHSDDTSYSIASHIKQPLFKEIEISEVLHESVQDKTKIFENKSMEITQAVPVYIDNTKSTTGGTNKLLHEDTKIFINKSMEITETVPISREAFQLNCHISLPRVLKENKKLLSNPIIDIKNKMSSNSVNNHIDSHIKEIESKRNSKSTDISKSYPYIYNKEKVLQILVKNNTQLFKNKLIEITETIPAYNKIDKSNCNVIQNMTEVGQKDIEIFDNKSMESIKTLVKHRKNLETSNQTEKVFKESSETKTKIFTNLPIQVTKPIHTYNHFYQSLSLSADKSLQEKIQVMKNATNEHTGKREINDINALVNDISEKKRSKILINKLDEMIQGTKLSFNKTIDAMDNIHNHRSNSLTNQQRTKLENKADQSFKNVITDFTVNSLHEVTADIKNYPWPIEDVKINCSSPKVSRYLQYNKEDIDRVNGTNTVTSIINAKHINCDEVCKLTENCNITSKNFTEVTSASPCRIKNVTLFSLCNNSKILSNNVNTVPNSLNNSINYNKERNYEITDTFNSKDKIFHRLTSDELNTLCASMNLPTDKYIADESITIENNYIPLWNDVNVLQDSLQKSIIFQQDSLQKSIIFQQDSVNKNSIKNNSEVFHNIIDNVAGLVKVSNNQINTLHTGIDTVTLERSSERETTVLCTNVNCLTQNQKLSTNIIMDSKTNQNILEINNLNKKEFNDTDKDNCESNIKFSENLEDIQPPSFLCSNSTQEDSIDNILTKNPLDSLSNNKQIHTANNLPHIMERNIKEISQQNIKQSLIKEFRKLSNENINFGLKQTKKSIIKIPLKNDNSKEIQKSLEYNKQEKEIEDSVTPFCSLIENLKAYEKRNDCIWTIQKINLKFIAVNFISKTFMVIIRLKEMGKNCNKDIENIEIVSCLMANSKDILLKLVHKVLLLKLKPHEISNKYKMFKDVLPMLKDTSSEVTSAMNFMFDLKRLSSINFLNLDDKRIIFMVASKKANIILKISLTIKIINKIDPDDIDVFCIVGDIRKNDIKQLIVNIKKDYKFLSRYINDIKDYITLMEESTYLNK